MTEAAPLLETPRLLLRPCTADNGPSYAGMCADAEVMRHIGAGQAQSAEEAWRRMAVFLGHWALRGHDMWARGEALVYEARR